MPGLVGGDIMRQAGVLGRAGVAVVVELESLAASVVEGVFSEAGVGNQDQAVSIRSPRDWPSQSPGTFKQIQAALNDGPDIDLVKLVKVASRGIEGFPLWPDKFILFLIPLRRRDQ